MRILKNNIPLLTLPVTFATFYTWLYWGNGCIKETEVSINSKKIPTSFNGFRIVHISDLHNKEFGHNQSRLLKMVKDSSPNLIAVTGDLIDSRSTDVQKALIIITLISQGNL